MDRIKCGEIYRTKMTGQLCFICFHCGTEFDAYSAILEHIDIHFQTIANDSMVDTVVKQEYLPDTIFSTATEPKIEEFDMDSEDIDNDSNSVHSEPINKTNDLFCIGEQQLETCEKDNHDDGKNDFNVGTVFAQYSCDICKNNKFYESRLQVYHHMRGCHGKKRQALAIYCDLCHMKFFSQKLLDWHKRPHKLEPTDLTCKYCGNISKYLCEHRRHFEVHRSNETLTCLICNNSKPFSNRKCLHNHMKRQHIEPQMKCDICHKQFRLRTNLESHRRTHTGEKPFPCTECGKFFRTSCYLKIHERLHRQEKPYQCSVCGKQFYSGSQVNQHIRSAHTNVVRPLKCSRCYKTFVTDERLQAHEEQHNQRFNCKICDKSFSSKKTLNSHSFLHKEKRYQCRYCDMCFVRTTGRRDHEKHRHNVVV